MIAFVRADTCRGCGEGVNIWWDGVRHVIRNRSLTWSPLHCCDDPEQRERIVIDADIRAAYVCTVCGDQDVAPTTWGRTVDFPSDHTIAAWAEAWVGPLLEHVCVIRGASERPVIPFRVWKAQ